MDQIKFIDDFSLCGLNQIYQKPLNSNVTYIKNFLKTSTVTLKSKRSVQKEKTTSFPLIRVTLFYPQYYIVSQQTQRVFISVPTCLLQLSLLDSLYLFLVPCPFCEITPVPSTLNVSTSNLLPFQDPIRSLFFLQSRTFDLCCPLKPPYVFLITFIILSNSYVLRVYET